MQMDQFIAKDEKLTVLRPTSLAVLTCEVSQRLEERDPVQMSVLEMSCNRTGGATSYSP